MRLDNSTLSVWTAIINDSTVIVPVELNNFTANISEGTVQLNWQTASELNNQGFEIQRRSPSPTPSLKLSLIHISEPTRPY